MIFILLISFMLLCTGCGTASLHSGHGEFLVVVMEESHCILKPLGEKIPEELKFSSGEVCPVQASIPEDFLCQAGDCIEADFYIAKNDPGIALLYPLLEFNEVNLLTEATPETIQEAREFEDNYWLTPEAEERWAEARLKEEPIPLPDDAEWIEIAFYGDDWTHNYRFTDAGSIAYILELLQADLWQNHAESGSQDTENFIYIGKDDTRYIIALLNEPDGIGLNVNVIQGEENSFERYYTVSGADYDSFIDNLKEICR